MLLVTAAIDQQFRRANVWRKIYVVSFRQCRLQPLVDSPADKHDRTEPIVHGREAQTGTGSPADRHTQPGTVAMVSYTANETTIEAIDMALSLPDKLRAEGIDATELQSGKSYREGLFPLGFETNSQLAAALGRLKYYAQPDTTVNDYTRQIDAVSDDFARTVIARVYPAPEDLVFVVIG